jgi:hypothetical protein
LDYQGLNNEKIDNHVNSIKAPDKSYLITPPVVIGSGNSEQVLAHSNLNLPPSKRPNLSALA